MTSLEVRLHDVSITGDVDRAAVLAAIERAVVQATSSGTPTTDALRAAVTRSVASSAAESKRS